MRTLISSPISVIELGDSLSGSFCGRLFHQLGAHVVKVEPPGGSPLRMTAPLVDGELGPLSTTFFAVNEGKETMVVDLDSPEGLTDADQLLKKADVIIMSGTNAQWAARNMAVDRLRSSNPAVVIGRVTVFGEEGPYADFVGGELQAQALGGLMNVVGEYPREPLRMGGYQAQYSTGMAMLSGFALGLFRRKHTGTGSSFCTSVIETVCHLEWKSAISYQVDGAVVTRGSDGAPAILRACEWILCALLPPRRLAEGGDDIPRPATHSTDLYESEGPGRSSPRFACCA